MAETHISRSEMQKFADATIYNLINALLVLQSSNLNSPDALLKIQMPDAYNLETSLETLPYQLCCQHKPPRFQCHFVQAINWEKEGMVAG